MKNELTCAVVRDLLPAYAEGLTAEETNAAVEAHLETCAECAARLGAMKTPEPPPAEEKEVDYLKTVRKRNWRRMSAAVLATAAALVLALAAWVFLIGSPMRWGLVSAGCYEEDGTLHLAVSSITSGNALRGWKVTNDNGVVAVTARSVLVSPLFSDGTGAVDIPLEGVTEVWLERAGTGRLVWQGGIPISEMAFAQWLSRTEYVGNASAVGELLDTFTLWYDQAPYDWTISLQTSARPYGLTLHFNDAVWAIPGAGDEIDRYMARKAPVLLALVGNMDEVHWTYPGEDGQMVERTVTVADANEQTGLDVKAVDSPADLEGLLALLR